MNPIEQVFAKLKHLLRKEQGSHENWDTALVPIQFRHAEFMVKNSAQFAETGGWGFARWLGA